MKFFCFTGNVMFDSFRNAPKQVYFEHLEKLENVYKCLRRGRILDEDYLLIEANQKFDLQKKHALWEQVYPLVLKGRVKVVVCGHYQPSIDDITKLLANISFDRFDSEVGFMNSLFKKFPVKSAA